MSPGDSLGYLHTTRGPWHEPASLPWSRSRSRSRSRSSRSHSRSLGSSRSRSSRGWQLLEGSEQLYLLLGEPFVVSAHRLDQIPLAKLDFAAIAECGITL